MHPARMLPVQLVHREATACRVPLAHADEEARARRGNNVVRLHTYAMDRTTPPSARSADPVMAEESGLARKTTRGAISSGGICSADSLEMKITRPHPARTMPGRYPRERRTPESTLVSKRRSQSSSGISVNGFASKMPTLFTRTSTSGTSASRRAAPRAVPRSAAMPRAPPPISRTAASTRSCVRPFTITSAPSRASARAMANLMPAVDPVTSALLPRSWRSMRESSLRRRTERAELVVADRLEDLERVEHVDLAAGQGPARLQIGDVVALGAVQLPDGASHLERTMPIRPPGREAGGDVRLGEPQRGNAAAMPPSTGSVAPVVGVWLEAKNTTARPTCAPVTSACKRFRSR